MKKLLCLLLCLAFFISPLPSYSKLTTDTHVIPIIGEAAETVTNVAGHVLDLSTVKLPKKIFNFEFEEEKVLLPNYFIKNQIGLYTAPLRLKYRDLSWFLPASGVLTALFLTDNDFEQALSNNFKPTRLQRDISNAFGQIGNYGPILGVPGGLVGIGYLTKNERLKETGILQLKGIAHSALIFIVASRIAGRNKPNNLKKGPGEFFEGGTSFPSGHALTSFTTASILAHQYPDKIWVPILAYTLAGLVAGSRATQGIHFPSDIFAGAVAGILIGRYIVKHNSQHAPGLKENKNKKL